MTSKMFKLLLNHKPKSLEERLHTTKAHSGGIFSALRHTLLVSRLLGLLPLSGLSSPTSDKLRFTFRSAYTIIYLMSMFGQFLMFFMTFYWLLQNGVSLINITNFFFYSSSLTSSIILMKIGRYWPQVIVAAESIEVTLPPFKSNITKVCNVIMTLVFTAAVVEHALSIFFGFSVAYSCYSHNDVVEIFFRSSMPWIFDYTTYSLWKGILSEIFNIQSTFIWSFNDLLIMVLSIYLTEHIVIHNALLKKAVDQVFLPVSRPELIALTTGNGNTNEDNVCINNQKILKIAGRQDVPIHRGSKASIITTLPVTNYFGRDGLGDSEDVYTDLIPAKDENAVSTLIQLSKTHQGELTVITLGALTNMALAIKMDPAFLSRINHLYIGAGHVHNAENPDPEFNAHMDVEAYHIVAKHATPDKVTMLPFSQAKQYIGFSKEWRENTLGAIPTDIIRQMNKFEKISMTKEMNWSALDPATVAVFLKPDLVREYKYSKNDIIVCGEKRGINTNDFVEKEDANVRIIHSIKTDEYQKFLLDIFGK